MAGRATFDFPAKFSCRVQLEDLHDVSATASAGAMNPQQVRVGSFVAVYTSDQGAFVQRWSSAGGPPFSAQDHLR